MSLSLTQKIKLTFDLASLRHEASLKLTGDEWKGYQIIRKRYDTDRRIAQATYRNEYDSRVETVRAELQRQAGAKTKDYKPRFAGNDRFDANALNRQADRHVQRLHQRDLDEIDRREHSAISKLLANAEHRLNEIARHNNERTYNNKDDNRKDPDDYLEVETAPALIKKRSRLH